MTNASRPPMPCVFADHNPARPDGTMVYFHPGGLPTSMLKEVIEQFGHWRIFRVELMLCAAYVEAIGKDGKVRQRIEAIAAEIQQQLQQQAVDDKPLIFMGWSFGGVVAYQVASQWAGRCMPDLVFIDSIAPITSHSFSENTIANRQTVKWFVQYLQALKRCRLSISNFDWSAQSTDKILQSLLDQAKAQGAFDPSTKLVAFKKVFTTFTQGLMRNSKLTACYKPPTYPGRLLLIRAKRGLLWRFKWIRHMGWKELVEALRVRALPFDHYQIISDPQAIELLVQQIDQFIYLHHRHAAYALCKESLS